MFINQPGRNGTSLGICSYKLKHSTNRQGCLAHQEEGIEQNPVLKVWIFELALGFLTRNTIEILSDMRIITKSRMVWREVRGI